MAQHSKVVGVTVNLDGDLWAKTVEVNIYRKLDRTLAMAGSYEEVVTYELRKFGPSHRRLMASAWKHLTHGGHGCFEREVSL